MYFFVFTSCEPLNRHIISHSIQTLEWISMGLGNSNPWVHKSCICIAPVDMGSKVDCGMRGIFYAPCNLNSTC